MTDERPITDVQTSSDTSKLDEQSSFDLSSPAERMTMLRRTLYASQQTARAARAAKQTVTPSPAPSPVKSFNIIRIDENFRRNIRTSGSCGSVGLFGQSGYRENAIVLACASAYQVAFGEPFFEIRTRQKGADARVESNPWLALLQSPIANQLSEAKLKRRIITHLLLAGNCYIHKVRSGTGKVIELWPYSPYAMTPVPSRERGREVALYDFHDVTGGTTPVPVEDVIALHWPVVDPDAPYRSMSPLEVLGREIGADTEMTRYRLALLENDAIPGTILSTALTAESSMLTAQQRETAEARFEEKFSGDSRGKVFAPPPGMSVQRLALNLKELAFDALRKCDEDRICAGFLIPRSVAGLGEEQTYSNGKNDVNRWVRLTLSPMWKDLADDCTQSLRAERVTPLSPDEYVWLNTDEVAALQDDASDANARSIATSTQVLALQQAYGSGTITQEMAIANAVQSLGISLEQAAALFPVMPKKTEPTKTFTNGHVHN